MLFVSKLFVFCFPVFVTAASIMYDIEAMEGRGSEDRSPSSGAGNRTLPYHEGLWKSQGISAV